MDTILSLVLTFCLFNLAYFLLQDARRKGLPPGPYPWPILGNLLQLGEMPHVHLANVAQSYGRDLFTIKLGIQTVVVASSPAAAAEILRTHDRNFCGRYVFHNFRIKNHVEFSMVWSECNDYWKMLRRICRTELFSPKMIEAQAHLREKKVSEMVGFLREKQGEVVKISEVVFGTLFNIFGNLIFSKDVFDLADPTCGSAEMKGHIWRLMELGNSTNPADYFPIPEELDLLGQRRAVAKCLQQIHDIWTAIIKERKENKGADSSHDFLHVLLEAQLNDHQINSLLMEMFGAGTETSASTIEWAVAELIKNPNIMAEVRSELGTVVGKNLVKESHLPHLTYLHACIKETLRLHPPTPLLLPHRALETCQLMNYTIPKDCQVMVNAWAIGRDPKTWEDPMIFSPNRFIGSNIEFKGNDFELLPFGSGRRICPGIPLATQFIHLIVASLVQNFDWSLPDGMNPSQLIMNEKFGLTLQKDPHLLIIPEEQV